MSLQGEKNSQSVTLVSGSTPTALAGNDLGVVITVPESPFTGEIATIQFDFQSPAIGGSAATVTGFGIGNLAGTIGGILFNFKTISESSYSVQVRLNPDTTEYTITVRANAAALASDANVTGPAEDVSKSFTIEAPAIVKPIVKIGVPVARPITARPVPLTFAWVYPDGTPVPVENFVQADISADVGTIKNFAQVTGDASKYTAALDPGNTTNTTVTITVSADAAQVENSSPAILGPEADTSKTFEIAAPTAVAQVTGADTVCILEKDIVSNDYLNDAIAFLGDNAGGGFTGVLEAVSIGEYFYLLVQIRKFTQTVDDDGDLVTPQNPENFLSDLQAGAALVRVNTDTCQFELLKAYPDVTLSARSLTVDGTDLYFIEGSHYMYEDNLIFSDQQWREKCGYVRKIEHPSSIIEEVGLNWRSATTTDNPDTEETDYFYGVHGATTAPIAIVDDALHSITGFGNFDAIGQPRGEHPVNRIGNWNWVQYHDQINQRLSEVLTNGRTGFDLLKDIAILNNAILGFENDTFFMRPREPQKAFNGSSGITATQRSMSATDLNWGEFPSEGYLLIGSELIKHAGADADGQFANLVRGAEGTTAAAHTGKFEITFVNHVLSLNSDTLEMPLKSVVIQNDNRQLYNRIRIRYGNGESVLVEDADSITENGARLLEVDVPLDAHQKVWAEWIANAYLTRFKDVQQVIQLTLKPTFYMTVADTVVIQIPERLHLHNKLCQALEIKHSFRKPPTTAVKLVTL